jgi:hypothetical protein
MRFSHAGDPFCCSAIYTNRSPATDNDFHAGCRNLPTKVVRHALQDAASVAGLLITTEAMVAEKPEPKSAMPAMPPGGMGGMDF